MNGAAEEMRDDVPAPVTARSTPEVLSSLIGNVADIVRTEIKLVRAELSDKADQARRGAVSTAMGAGMSLIGLVFVILAAISALEAFSPLPFWASSLAVGGGIALIGLIMLKRGTSKLKPKNLEPTQSEENIRRDAALAKEIVQ